MSDIGAGVDAGATAVEDPSTQPAVADAVATPGFDPGMLASDVPADTGIPTDVPADSGDPAAQGAIVCEQTQRPLREQSVVQCKPYMLC